jgi:RHH-type proline utilization regulon transcriptional repressor/proline dehydrogenase/delta 1-pyrroline-5-carboxylate dehydrogenase
LQERAAELQTPAERRQQAELDRMLQTPSDKATLVQLTDQVFRSRSSARVAAQFTHILNLQGIPRFFGSIDRALLRGFQAFGEWLPAISVPLAKEHLRSEAASVVLSADSEDLREHLDRRRAQGIRMNLNFLGEALLGERQAGNRLRRYLDALRSPEIEVLSVKISTLYSRITPIAREHTLGILSERLGTLFQAAAGERFVRKDGSSTAKFIYLDMEEYRDLHLTADAFQRTLSQAGFENISAGIALQAYLPDSFDILQRLVAWARERTDRGGAPITIRIVKGANMEMERVDAALHGWPQAPFQRKRETDANYHRMLATALSAENRGAVKIGVASHNLFDLAYGLLLAIEMKAGEAVQFEMLEGMAAHQRRALAEHLCGPIVSLPSSLLLYAPVCQKDDFLHAIGYLIRRLDENTGDENFLRHAFRLTVGSTEWQRLEQSFRESFSFPISDRPRRGQDRRCETFDRPLEEKPWMVFYNEPDTDFSLPQNGQWAEQIVADRDTWPALIPLSIGDRFIAEERKPWPCRDPSRAGAELTRYCVATADDAEQAVRCAREKPAAWRSLSVDARNERLGHVATELRRARSLLIRAALANGGKTIAEADPEVSEAIDFVEFYRSSARSFFDLKTVSASPFGVIVVVPPWNFPIAIPCGGIAAALAAGNHVILKPASDTVLVAWELCQCFWRAGVPRSALQFLPCSGDEVAAALVSHPDVDGVILTGGTATAQRMLANRPEMRLFAETGGKNAMIVTALSDREQAIKHAVHSAFSHAGQKCSATSLLLLEAEVYDDPTFRGALCDAVESVRASSAWALETRMGPLIRPPSGVLASALTSLDEGESWAVLPRRDPHDPHRWTPAVKWDVQPGSKSHLTEFFGPVLSVMRFESLDEAIDLANATGYGLTGGLQSLDEREMARWQQRIFAGNLYINKPTVGAIVLRQPFGGWGKSSFGPGMKAGGPHYLAQFMHFEDRFTPHESTGTTFASPGLESLRQSVFVQCRELPEFFRLLAALASYDRWMREEFSREHDHFRLIGEDNIRRYLPIGTVLVRIERGDSYFSVFARAAAAHVTGNRLVISSSGDGVDDIVFALAQSTKAWGEKIDFVVQSTAVLEEFIAAGSVHRLRYSNADRIAITTRQAALAAHVTIVDRPVLAEGRIELLWYLREQSISYAYHRYGNLGARVGEPRRGPD